MRRTLAVLLVLWLIPATARASFVLLMVTNERIVAVSDSRRWFVDRAGTLEHFLDDAVKVRVSGRLLVATTMYDKGNGTRTLDIDRAIATAPARPGETPAAYFDRLIETLQRQPVDTTGLGFDVTLTVGVYGFDGPQAVGVSATLINVGRAPAAFRSPPHALDPAPCVTAMGWDVFRDDGRFRALFLARLKAAARWISGGRPTEAATIREATDFVRTVSGWTKTIGGPVHVVVLDSAGVRWVR